MTWWPFMLLVVGLVLTVAGWFFDRLAHFPRLERLVAKQAHDALNGLGLLAQNERHGLLPAHPGFRPLVAAWPGLAVTANATTIARSVAFMEIGVAAISNDFELIARLSDNTEISPRWRHASAIDLFQSRMKKRVFWLGTAVFWTGIVVSLSAGLIELSSRMATTSPNSTVRSSAQNVSIGEVASYSAMRRTWLNRSIDTDARLRAAPSARMARAGHFRR